MVAQPTAEQLADMFREVARLQKRAEWANREAAQAAAQTHDMLIEFCVANGVTIRVVD